MKQPAAGHSPGSPYAAQSSWSPAREAMRDRRLYTVKQIAERHPGITERTLRHWIFNAKQRRGWEGGRVTVIPGNGFDTVMVRAGRKILIDEAALFRWLEPPSD